MSAPATDRPVILRLKRGRAALTPDEILVAAPPSAKRAATRDITDALAALGGDSASAATPSTHALPDEASTSPPAAAPPVVYTFRKVDSLPCSTGAPAAANARSKALLRHVRAFAAGSSAPSGSKLREGGGGAGVSHERALARVAAASAAHASALSSETRARHAADRRKRAAGAAGSANGASGGMGRTATGEGDVPGSREDPLRAMFRVFDLLPGSATAAAAAATAAPGAAATPTAAVAGGAAGAEGSASATVLDFQSMRVMRRHAGIRDAFAAEWRAAFEPTAALQPHRVFSPAERVMDEAVWRAFRFDDLSAVFTALQSGGSGVVNFQRTKSDLTTALMATAYHGHARAALSLLRQNALVRIKNAHGQTAVDIARERGHTLLADMLHSVLLDEVEEVRQWQSGELGVVAGPEDAPSVHAGAGAAGGEGATDGEEYDIYALVPTPHTASASAGAATDDSAGTAAAPALAPVVHIEDEQLMQAMASGSRARARVGAPSVVAGEEGDDDAYLSDSEWLEGGAGGRRRRAGGDDSEDEDYDSEDSNDENAAGNEYPDEDEWLSDEELDEDGEWAFSSANRHAGLDAMDVASGEEDEEGEGSDDEREYEDDDEEGGDGGAGCTGARECSVRFAPSTETRRVGGGGQWGRAAARTTQRRAQAAATGVHYAESMYMNERAQRVNDGTDMYDDDE